MCCSKCVNWENDLGQNKHLWGFSPLCAILCLVRFVDVEKDLLHKSQTKLDSTLSSDFFEWGFLGLPDFLYFFLTLKRKFFQM